MAPCGSDSARPGSPLREIATDVSSHVGTRIAGGLMNRRRPIPTALTIAGSDSGGGAGIQADLKTFASLGVHGASAVTCVTAQNPKRVRAIQQCDPNLVRQQIEAVFDELPPAAVKTGMLFSTGVVRVVVSCLRRRKRPPLIVDPVMVSTSGIRL